MKYKAIVTTNINQYSRIKDRGYCEQEEVDYTEITNILFPVSTPFPPVDLWALGLGAGEEDRSIGTPHHALDKIEFINPLEINLELTEKVNVQIHQMTENWESFLFLEFYNGKIYESQKSFGIAELNQFIIDWVSKNEKLNQIENKLINEIVDFAQKSTNFNSRVGRLFIIKKKENDLFLEAIPTKNFKTSIYRGNSDWWWLE